MGAGLRFQGIKFIRVKYLCSNCGSEFILTFKLKDFVNPIIKCRNCGENAYSIEKMDIYRDKQLNSIRCLKEMKLTDYVK